MKKLSKLDIKPYVAGHKGYKVIYIPFTKNEDQMVIEAVFGLGELLVQRERNQKTGKTLF